MIKKIIFSIAICSSFTPTVNADQAVTIPYRHEQAKSTENERDRQASQNFVERAYESARMHSPFAAVLPEPVSYANVDLGDKMVDYAARFLGTRYILGATGPKAFDCSGFTSYVYRNFGITLNRTSRMQYTQGKKISISQLEPGDLLFFSCRSSGRGNVGHVAMVASVDHENNTCVFIHASVKKGVTYQKFPDGGYFDRNFIGARRIIGTNTNQTES
ncbi:MAG: C40 family peptidase [Muribaculaceae bacterium]|nr:C40 family peptidase [Muribaculaceae bacterium]